MASSPAIRLPPMPRAVQHPVFIDGEKRSVAEQGARPATQTSLTWRRDAENATCDAAS